jgi:hypothetical protein
MRRKSDKYYPTYADLGGVSCDTIKKLKEEFAKSKRLVYKYCPKCKCLVRQ